ncbi:hypothetical protein MOQ_007382 [Trypanosoma cruzi marinkellei]|uniref:Uncharacterized protein n=1 Tax=Trypanosoma cruzi marinkellei TaxID=85056 RepID=K2MT47_TRYCR|nr:hypothetical protein MOQ_007382 [Trypanosoma cruzi marinkellei]
MHPSSNVIPRKQLCACHAYECVWDACNVTDAGSGKEHTAGQRKQVKQNTIIILSCLVLRTKRDARKSPQLSAGTHSPHTILQPRVVYASADTASSSGAHTHAELLRLPSISRGRDGARVVVVVGASVVVVLGASGAVVVVVVFVVSGAFSCGFCADTESVTEIDAAVGLGESPADSEPPAPPRPCSELAGAVPKISCGAAFSSIPFNLPVSSFALGVAGPLDDPEPRGSPCSCSVEDLGI